MCTRERNERVMVPAPRRQYIKRTGPIPSLTAVCLLESASTSTCGDQKLPDTRKLGDAQMVLVIR